MKRYLNDIKFEFMDSDILITFNYEKTFSNVWFKIDELDGVMYNDDRLYFYNGKDTDSCYASKEDFDNLNKVLSKTSHFANCGNKYIFNTNNVISFQVEKSNCLMVDCRNSKHYVELNKMEQSKSFVNEMKKKWNKTVSKWSKINTILSEEEGLSK